MKNFGKLMTGVVLFGALVLMPSCESAGDDLEITFPEVDNVTGTEAGEVQTVTFDAATNWSLNSDASWIKFNNDGAWLSSITGKAGEQTVEYMIEESGWGITETTANITLKMDEQSEVVVVVVRPAKSPEISFYTYSEDGAYTEIDMDPEKDVLCLDADGYSGLHRVRLGVKSNLAWTLEIPDWIAEGNPTEYESSEETVAIWLDPEYRAFQFEDEMKGEIKIAIKDNPEVSYSIAIETLGANKLMLCGNEHAVFNFNSYGLYDLPDNQGIASSYAITLTTGATEENIQKDDTNFGALRDISFQNDNCVALQYFGEGDDRTYKVLKDVDNGYGFIIEKAWASVNATIDPNLGRAWVERSTGTYSIMKYGYTISCTSNEDDGSTERRAIIVALPYSYFDAKGSCDYVEFLDANDKLKPEFKQYIIGEIAQDGEIPKNSLMYPTEALMCGATMRLMDPTNAEDKAYMDARIAEMTGEGFETYKDKIVYANMWELSYDHPSSSMWAAIAPANGAAQRDNETKGLDNIYTSPLGLVYIPEQYYGWIGYEIDDFAVVTMSPDIRIPEADFEPLDGWMVIRPLQSDYTWNEETEKWDETLSEPVSYQFIRCKIKSNKVPDNFDEMKPDRAPRVNE